jgi:hypothetical protein
MRRLCSLVLMIMTAAVFAQPVPEHPQPDVRDAAAVKRLAAVNQWVARTLLTEHPVVVQSPTAVFIYRNGILAKYDARTLEPRGTIDLVGPDDVPVRGRGENKVNLQQFKRLLPAALLLRDTDLLFVAGETYARISLEPFKVLVKKPLVPADEADADPARQLARVAERLASIGVEPVLSQRDGTLIAVRGITLTAINIADGRMLATATLPAEMRPVAEAVKARDAKKLPAANVPNPTALVGTVLKQNDNGDVYWTLKDDKGKVYILDGAGLKELMAAKEILGTRIRANGTLTDPTEDDPEFSTGTLTITDYQPLGK